MYGSSSHAVSMPVEVVALRSWRIDPRSPRAGSCIRIERGAQRLGGPVEPRLRGPQRDAHGCGGVRQRQAQVVVKDDDGAVLGIEVADATLELIPVGGGRLVSATDGVIDLGELDLDAPTLDRPELTHSRR